MAKKGQDQVTDAKPATGDEKGHIVRANVHREVLEPDEKYVSLYANDIQVLTTPWDVRLVFGQIFNAPTASNPIARVRQVGEARFSPQLAKRLAEILAQQLDHYEADIGPIPQPRKD